MPQYEIAGSIINIDCDIKEPLEKMDQYHTKSDLSPDLNITFNFQEYIKVPEGEVISDDNISICWVKKPSGQNGYYFYITEAVEGTILAMADAEQDWKNALITCRDFTQQSPKKSFSKQTWAYTHAILGVVFRYNLIQYDGIVIHASSIKVDGKGILFSAPSGTGKSTHVNLWKKIMGDQAVILNDDTPAVRMVNNQAIIYGTPWCGSSFINSNDQAPLSAIVILEQAPYNKIERIMDQEAIIRLLPRVFTPYFDQSLMNIAFSIFENIISNVPVYLLRCKPDKEAVELVYQCLK